MNHTQMWLFMTNQAEPLRQSSLLMLIAGGIGHGDTLLHSLRAHEVECQGTWAGKVGQLRLLMEQGHLLSSALTVVGEILPDATISAIRVAEGTATLPDTLMDEARRISSQLQSNRQSGVSIETLIVWLPAMLVVILGLASFMLIFITPKLKEIFIGFGVELPPITKAFISVGDWAGSSWVLFWMPFLAFVVYCTYFYYSSERRRMVRGYHRLAERFPRYWVPGMLRQMSLAAATEMPLSMALDSTLQNLPEGRAANRISELRHRVQSGQSVLTAMQQTRLLNARETAFLESALRTHHLDWGLRHLADGIDRRRGRLIRRFTELIGPIVIVLVGLVVLFVVVAMFQPLVKVIHQLAAVG